MTMIVVGLALSVAAVFCVMSLVYEVPINPPVAVIVRRFGKIAKVVFGGKWLIILPYIESAEKVDITQFMMEIKNLTVTTPDNVSSTMQIAIRVRPVPDAEALTKYFLAGGEKGVRASLAEIAEQETRQWARNDNEEPKDWQQLQSSQDKLVKKLRGKFAEACGAADTEDRAGAIHLREFGIFLEGITVGEIVVEESIRNEKTKGAQEKIQRDAELSDTRTQLARAELLAGTKPSVQAAFQQLAENEVLRQGKGGVYRVGLSDLRELKPLLALLKKVLSDKED